jgi:hypothetical protein
LKAIGALSNRHTPFREEDQEAIILDAKSDAEKGHRNPKPTDGHQKKSKRDVVGNLGAKEQSSGLAALN